MHDYLKAQSKTNDAIIANKFSPDELNRFSKSDYRWVDTIYKQFRHRTVKKGEIYQFEFGKNFKPEMSYEHRGLVIGVKKKLLYVLPIFSYDPIKHSDIYHPIDFPNSKSDIYLLKKENFPFITHDSVLKLNDLRTVSVNRIIYQHNGLISPSSDTYKIIEELVIQKYFPAFHYNYIQLSQNEAKLKSLIKESEENLNKLTAENQIIREQIQTLTAQLKSQTSNLISPTPQQKTPQP